MANLACSCPFSQSASSHMVSWKCMLDKNWRNQFFNVIITKIKGRGKNPETSMASQWLYFPGVPFSQGNGSALPWAGEPPKHNWQLKPKMNFVCAELKGRPSVNIVFHTSAIKHQFIFMEQLLSCHQRFLNFLHMFILTTRHTMFILPCGLIGRPKWN